MPAGNDGGDTDVGVGRGGNSDIGTSGYGGGARGDGGQTGAGMTWLDQLVGRVGAGAPRGMQPNGNFLYDIASQGARENDLNLDGRVTAKERERAAANPDLRNAKGAPVVEADGKNTLKSGGGDAAAPADNAGGGGNRDGSGTSAGVAGADPKNNVFWNEEAGYYVNENGKRVNKAGELFSSPNGNWVNGVNQAQEDAAWQTGLDETVGGVTDEVLANFTRQGIDGSVYLDDYITPYLSDITEGIAPGTENVGSYFNDDDIYNAIKGNVAGDVNRQNELAFADYTDPNYLMGAYDVTDPLSAITSSILDPQKQTATDFLGRALNTGVINQQGYDRGISEIDNLYTTGSQDINTASEGVLTGYRTDTNDWIDNAFGTATSWDFGDPYDFAGFQSGLDSRISSDLGGYEGDVRGSLGDKEYFDLSGIVQEGVGASGIFNPQGASLKQSIADRDKKETGARGLGTQGAF